MKHDLYRKAMDQLPFHEDLEAKTIALLEASSAAQEKEETNMKNTVQKPEKPHWNSQKILAWGGGVLAVAAAAVLVLTPLLQTNTLPLVPAVVDQGGAVLQSNAAKPSTDAPIAPPMDAETSAKTVAETAAETGAAPPLMDAAAPEGEWVIEDTDMILGAVPLPGAAGSFAYAPTAPDWNTNEYNFIQENRFLSTKTSPLSTFAADVDTASYAQLRASLLQGQAVTPDSVRIEEMLNYFHYDYALPKDNEPFGVTLEVAPCPWNKDTQLLLVGLQAKKIDTKSVPPQNLVFLIDVSGSMDEPNKLPLVKRSFGLLLEELKPADLVSIVTYAGEDRVVLDGVPASEKTRIMEALEDMYAGGGTAGAAGITTAYEIAKKHLLPGGSNRVILATDGDLNIGVSDEGSLTRLIEDKRKDGVFLSVLGFGDGNYKDNKLEALADHGNGNYAYIDTIHEARKALVEEIGATFLTVAKDVKLQVDFNPAKIMGYRLIGYENRLMEAEDFADDRKDGGEVGSGHRVTALYEIVPLDSPMVMDAAETKYQTAATSSNPEWLTVNIRAKEPEGDTSKLYSYPMDASMVKASMSDNLRFSAAVAEFGMLLRDSEFKGDASYDQVLELLRGVQTLTGDVYKEELLYLVSQAKRGLSPAE